MRPARQRRGGFHPRSKSSLTVFSGRVRATECENEVDGLRHRLVVNLLMPVREASPLGLEGFDESSKKSCQTEVTRGSKVNFGIRRFRTSEIRNMFYPAQEGASTAQ